jgi:hypothetical protein
MIDGILKNDIDIENITDCLNGLLIEMDEMEYDRLISMFFESVHTLSREKISCATLSLLSHPNNALKLRFYELLLEQARINREYILKKILLDCEIIYYILACGVNNSEVILADMFLLMQLIFLSNRNKLAHILLSF